MQSSCEVMEALMRGGSPERVGLFEPVWHDTQRKWVDEGYPTNDGGSPVAPWSHFGFDMVPVGTGVDFTPLMGASEVVEESEEWIVRRNGAGAALKYWKNKSGTPEHVDFRMTSREVWERDYRPFLVGFDENRINPDAVRAGMETARAAGKWSMCGQMFVWEIMRQSMGDVCMYESLVLDPDWIHDFCRVYTDFYTTHLAAVFERAGRPNGARICEDLGYKGRLFCRPEILAELIFPYYAELVEFYHSWDMPVWLHTCGWVEDALPLILEAGFDGLDPMERRAGCDPFLFAEKTDGKLCLRGGFDKTVLESGDRDAIRDHAVEMIEGMKARGVRYVFSTDHSLSTLVALDDYRYMLDVYREHMAY